MKKILIVSIILISSVFYLNAYAVQPGQQMMDVKKSKDDQKNIPNDAQMMDKMTNKMMGNKIRMMGRRMMMMGVKMRMMGNMMQTSEDQNMKTKAKMMIDMGIKMYTLGREISDSKKKKGHMRRQMYQRYNRDY